MTRNAKPASVLRFEGKSHKTKAELAEREAAEIKIGDKVFMPPAYITGDFIAMEKWSECAGIFKDFDLVSSSDVGHLARYCKMYSEYRDLLIRRAAIAHIEVDYDEGSSIEMALQTEMSKKKASKLLKKIEFIISTSGVLEMDSAINKKADQLTKMEDRLFLNPQAKIKTQGKKKEKETNPLDEAGFANV
jgi:phage terminase small subunit